MSGISFNRAGRILLSVLCLGIGLQCISCASMGTQTKVVAPETIPSIDRVAVWPVTALPFVAIAVDEYPEFIDDVIEGKPSLRKEAVELGRESEELLVYELKRQKLFKIVEPDTIVATLSPEEWIDFRLDRLTWDSFDPIEGVDYVLATQVRFKTGTRGTNTYITLSVYDWNREELVVECKFNTYWGKSYSGWFPPSHYKTLPDAIEGAVKGLAKEWKRYTKSK